MPRALNILSLLRAADTLSLFRAAHQDNVEAVRDCARRLGNVEDCKDTYGRTALHVAAGSGSLSVTQYLVEGLKMEVDIKTANGCTALLFASVNHYPQVMKYLIEQGAKLNEGDVKGIAPLHPTARRGNLPMTEMLISRGAEIDAESKYGTPLIFAVTNKKIEAVKFLLDHGANPNASTVHGWTPLFESILINSVECTKLILEAGADPNLGSHGLIPLGAAARWEKIELVKALIEAKADPDKTDDCGLTALEHAVLVGDEDELGILFQVTSRIPSFPNWSLTGIINHIMCDEVRTQRAHKEEELIQFAKAEGKDSFEKKDYWMAQYWYTRALSIRIDAALFSNRSACWARLAQGNRALEDAKKCIRIRPNWPKSHYREGVAHKILQKYPEAAGSFCWASALDPENEELQAVFWETLKALADRSGVAVESLFPFLRVEFTVRR